jgi:hypothetical protein
LQAPTAEEVSIAPDKFQLWPHDLNQTTQLALYPQPDDFLFDLFDRGRADALAWAQQQGFPAEVVGRLTVKAAAATAGEGAAAGHDGVLGGANLVPADAVELPAELRVARRVVLEQKQQQQGGSAGVRQQQQQQEAAAVALAQAGMKEAGAVMAASARWSVWMLCKIAYFRQI